MVQAGASHPVVAAFTAGEMLREAIQNTAFLALLIMGVRAIHGGAATVPAGLTLLVVPLLTWLADPSSARQPSHDKGHPLRRDLAMLLLLGCLTAPVCFVGLEDLPHHMTGDEGMNADLALHYLDSDQLSAVTPRHVFEPSLPFLIQARFLDCFGISLEALRLPTAAMGWIAGLGVYLLSRFLTGPWPALSAGLLFTFLPSHLAYLRSAETTGMVPALQVFSLCCALLGFLRKRPVWLLLSGSLAGLGALLYLSALAHVVVLSLWVAYECWRLPEEDGPGLLWAAMYALGLILLLGPFILFSHKVTSTILHVTGLCESVTLCEEWTERLARLPTLLVSLVGEHAPGSDRLNFPAPLWLLTLAGFTAALLRSGVRPPIRRALLFLVFLAPCPVLAARMEPLALRRFVFFSVPLALGSGIALETLASWWRRAWPQAWPRGPSLVGTALVAYLVFAGLQDYGCRLFVDPDRQLLDTLVVRARGEPRVLRGTFLSSTQTIPDSNIRFLMREHGVDLVSLPLALRPTSWPSVDLLAPRSILLEETLQEMAPGTRTKILRGELEPDRMIVSLPSNDLEALRGLQYLERYTNGEGQIVASKPETVPGLVPGSSSRSGARTRVWSGYVLITSPGLHHLTLSGPGSRLSLSINGEQRTSAFRPVEARTLLSEGFHRVVLEQDVPGRAASAPTLSIRPIGDGGKGWPATPETLLFWPRCPGTLRGAGLSREFGPLWLTQDSSLLATLLEENTDILSVARKEGFEVALTRSGTLLQLQPPPAFWRPGTPVQWTVVDRLPGSNPPLEPDEIFTNPRADLDVIVGGTIAASLPHEGRAYLIRRRDNRSIITELLPEYSFFEPGPVAMDRSTGRVWVGDRTTGSLQIFSPEGQPIRSISVGSLVDLAPSEEGGILVLTAAPGLIRHLGPLGGEKKRWPWPGVNRRDYLKPLPGGDLALVRLSRNEIVVLDSSGQMKALPRVLQEPPGEDLLPPVVAVNDWGPRGIVLMRESGGVQSILEIFNP